MMHSQTEEEAAARKAEEEAAAKKAAEEAAAAKKKVFVCVSMSIRVHVHVRSSNVYAGYAEGGIQGVRVCLSSVCARLRKKVCCACVRFRV